MSKKIKGKTINKAEFFALMQHVAEERQMDIKEVIEFMVEAFKKSFAINFDPDAKLEIIINPEKEEFSVVNTTKIVVPNGIKLDDDIAMIEINLKDAKKINPAAKINDVVAAPVNVTVFTNSISSQISQLFKQELIKKYKNNIYEKYKDLKGQIVTAKIIAVLQSQVLFKMDKNSNIEAMMPNNLRNMRQQFSLGQDVEVYVEDVREFGKGQQIIVSNGSKEFVRHFLKLEIPEINDGLIEIVVIARIPGVKTKIAIKSNQADIDPLGSVIGPRGSRINQVSDHLYGEKIDVIKWSEDINEFISNAISPAKVIGIMDKDETETSGGKLLIVPNHHQTLAIGGRGVNVKLASMLTQSKLDVISLSQANDEKIKFEWNGNATPEMVEQIERGEKIHFNNSRSRSQFDNIIDFDHDIDSFNQEIAELDSSKQQFSYESKPKTTWNKKQVTNTAKRMTSEISHDDFDLDKLEFDKVETDDFSDEALKQIEAEFGNFELDFDADEDK